MLSTKKINTITNKVNNELTFGSRKEAETIMLLMLYVGYKINAEIDSNRQLKVSFK